MTHFKISIAHDVEYWCVDFELVSTQTPETKFSVSTVSYDLPRQFQVNDFLKRNSSELQLLGVGFELTFKRIVSENIDHTLAFLVSSSFSQLDMFPWPKDLDAFMSVHGENISCTKVAVKCDEKSLGPFLNSFSG